ncbi:MAG TPA: AzlC family ABC transporter permease, partial [Pseudolabrys sp.]|nr:AzlC family ABC transporter permease [Pseudolabrys sp.]
WSLAGFRHGVRLGLPVTPGVIAFGLIVGAVAERQGFSFLHHAALTVLVYSGIAQLVALEIWPKLIDVGAIMTLSALTAVIGSRLFLMSVSMRPWFGKIPRWQAYTGLFLLTDASWLIAMRYQGEGGRDPAVYFGAAVIITLGWFAGTAIGYFLGGFVVEPKKYGLDLVLPVFFAAMLVPLWSGARRAIGWGVAGLVAVTAQQMLPGYWFIIIGAVFGALVGGLLDDANEEAARAH